MPGRRRGKARCPLAAAIVAGTLVACSEGSSTGDDVITDAPVETGAPHCPAAGHRDTFASGLTPERIPDLPSGYSFTFVKADGCTPVRFDPCQPVHYVMNPAQAPPGGVADVEEAFNRLAQVTGITFVNEGMTDEVVRRGPYAEDRYPGRWAPILVAWSRQSGERANVEVVGSGFPSRVDDVLVSGTLTITPTQYPTGRRAHRFPQGSPRRPGSARSAPTG